MSIRGAAWSTLAVILLALAYAPTSAPQGMATGNATAQPARPLPKGMKAPVVDYRDVAVEAGLTAVSISGAERNKQYIVETTGTGVAILDYDKDGLQDIFFVNGSRFEPDAPKSTHRLYRNLGKLKFEDVTEKAGIVHTGWGQGVCAGDADDDGWTDLFVTHWGANVLLRNAGNGTFTDDTRNRGLTAKHRWSSGCAFLDYDRDGDLDLFVSNYLDFDPKSTPRPGDKAQCMWKGLPVICGPRGLPAETMSLYRNEGKGVYTDVSAKAGISGDKNFYGFTALTADFDNDGWVDIYVACDSTASLLYRNKKDGTFEEIGLISGAALNEDGREQAGMGATAADYDGDGLLDIFKTNFSDDTPTLYKNNGDATFTDVTISAGLAVNTKFLGWGTAFLDFDHDGRKDIFEANGHVYPEVDNAPFRETFKQQRVLYWNRGDGQFHDISRAAGAGIIEPHASRGIAIGDLDNDGSLEIVTVNMHERPSLIKNAAASGNSLLVQALTASGRDAIGARLTLTVGAKKQIDEVRSGGYHISQSDFRVHFGLGAAAKAHLAVRWPDGSTQAIGDIPAGHWTVVQQGKGIVASRKLAPQ